MPDLRPSSPFSSGPTLFLAPSPVEWQGRHLLNDVLPAATSCACALDKAAAEHPMRITALKPVFFIVLSPVWPCDACGTTRLPPTTHKGAQPSSILFLGGL